VNNAPKGFDIDMMEVMTKYELTLDQVRHLGHLTATRGGIAHATIGHKVYYRSRQIEELFNVKPRTDVNPVDIAEKIKDMNEEASRTGRFTGLRSAPNHMAQSEAAARELIDSREKSPLLEPSKRSSSLSTASASASTLSTWED
jgi:hypothetical protein